MSTTDRILPFVFETSTTSGTGTLTLAGAVTGYRTFLGAYGSAGTAVYTLANSDYSKWEIGYGTVSGATLTRNLLVSSTGALIDFLGATINVYSGSMAFLINSMLRDHFSATRPGWLPSMGTFLDDLGSNLAQLTLYDGTDEIGYPFVFDTSANTAYIAATGLSHTLTYTDAGATYGPLLIMDRNSASQAAADAIGHILFRGRDSAGNAHDYAQIGGIVIDPTNGSEDGSLDFYTFVGASLTFGLSLSAGIQVGTPTGGAKGTGTVNLAAAGYVNNQDFVDASGILMPASFTVGTLPTKTARRLIYVSDGTANKRLAICDGTNARFPDGNVVS